MLFYFYLQESETYLFECGRWLARDEDDGQIVRELAPVSKVAEKIGPHGKVKRQESKLTDTLKSKSLSVHKIVLDHHQLFLNLDYI